MIFCLLNFLVYFGYFVFNMLLSIWFYLKWFWLLFFVFNIGLFFVFLNLYIVIYVIKYVYEKIILKYLERSMEIIYIMSVMFVIMYLGEKDNLDLNN